MQSRRKSEAWSIKITKNRPGFLYVLLTEKTNYDVKMQIR